MSSLRTSVAVSLLSATYLLAGCGASNDGGRGAAAAQVGSQSSTNATVAAQANDPRSNDATAAQPPLSKTAVAGAAAPSSGSTGAGSASGATDPQMLGKPAAKSTTKPTRIGARHVLIQWIGSERAGNNVLRTREQARAVAEDVLKKAKAGTDLGRLAVEYSDEPNAGTRGGSLGRFGKGSMVPAFEAVAFELEVGEVSEIVETPFGYHIIQRTE